MNSNLKVFIGDSIEHTSEFGATITSKIRIFPKFSKILFRIPQLKKWNFNISKCASFILRGLQYSEFVVIED